MNLYLMRHGEAEDFFFGSDPERRLTEGGRESVGRMGKELARMEIAFDAIVCSPYLRARETAEIVSRETRFGGEIITDSRLIPSGHFESISDLIREYSDTPSTLLVGHQPLIGETISRLAGEGRLMIAISPGTVAAVETTGFRPHVHGVLLWSVPPDLFL